MVAARPTFSVLREGVLDVVVVDEGSIPRRAEVVELGAAAGAVEAEHDEHDDRREEEDVDERRLHPQPIRFEMAPPASTRSARRGRRTERWRWLGWMVSGWRGDGGHKTSSPTFQI